MSALLDPNSVSVWPPAGGRIDIDRGEAESPTEAHSLDVGSLVSSVVSTLDVEAEKTAALVVTKQGVGLTEQNIWRHADAHPITLMLMLLDRYGQDYVTWDPEVLKLTLERDGTKVSNDVWNKVLAGRVVLNSPSPWRQWEVFHWVSRALCGQTPNFVYLEEPEIGHMVVGYSIMKAVDPKRPTGIEVDKFVAAAFRHEGIVYAPKPLDFAQREIEDRKVECTNCDALHRDDNDIKCVTCGSSKLVRPDFEFKALRDETADMFEKRRKLPLAQAVEDLPDTGAGNAVYRLLVEWDLANTAQAQLVQQLRMIGGK